MNFTGANILSVEQFNRDSIDQVFQVADRMLPYARRQKRTRVLDGAILGFFVVPWAIKAKLPDIIHEQTGKIGSLAEASFNPFTPT